MSYKKEKRQKKNKMQIHWGRNFGMIAVILCLGGLLSYFSLNIYKNERTYGNPSLNEVVGYQVEENNYTVLDEKEHYLTFSIEEDRVRGLYLYFGAPLGVDTLVTAHFYFEGSEVKTIQTVIPAADAYTPLLCGSRQVDTIRLSIDGNFLLSSAMTEFIYEADENNNQVLLQIIVAIVVVLLIVGAWAAGQERTEKIIRQTVSWKQNVWDFISKDWRTIVRFFAFLVGGVFCGNLLWFLLAQVIPSRVWGVNWHNFVFGSMIGLVLVVIVSYFRSQNMKFETMFLCCGFIFSCALTLLLPLHLNLSWDDQIHYNNAACLSHGARNVMSVSEHDYYQSCFYPMLKQYGEGNVSELAELLKDTETNQASMETELGFALRPNTLVYLPVALMLFVCRGLGIPTHLCVLLGRMSGAWFFLFIMYLGMKHLKSGKMVMAAVSFVPVCLFVTTNFNYDYWLLALTGFSIAYMIGEYQRPDKVLQLKDLLLIYVPFVVGLAAKPVYIPLLGMAAFFPKSKFKSQRFLKGYRLFFVGMVICAAAGFAVLIFGGGLGTGDLRGGAEVNASAQVQYILSNPLPYMKTLFGFLKEYLSLEKILFNLVDTAYIPVKTWLGLPTLIWLLLVCILDREKKENQKIAWYVKVAVIPLAFITACCVASAMYVMYTAVGAGTVAGCSGRYLLPVLFPLLIIVSRIRFFVVPQTEKTKRWTEAAVMGISLVPAMIMMTIFV